MTEADLKSAATDAVAAANFTNHVADCTREKNQLRQSIDDLIARQERMHKENSEARDLDRKETETRFKAIEGAMNGIGNKIAWAAGAITAAGAVIGFALKMIPSH